MGSVAPTTTWEIRNGIRIGMQHDIFSGEPVTNMLLINLSEAAKAAALSAMEVQRSASHPNIVAMHGASILHGEDDSGTPVPIVLIMMEPVSISLADAVLSGGPLADAPTTTRLRWLIEIAHAISYCHKYNVIHGDVNPTNIMLSSVSIDATAKLTGIGMSKVTAPSHKPSKKDDILSFGKMALTLLDETKQVDAEESTLQILLQYLAYIPKDHPTANQIIMTLMSGLTTMSAPHP